MKISKTLALPLALPLAGAVLASGASAQVVYGTNGTTTSNYLLDVTTTVSTPPLFAGAESSGLADDDPNQTLYISDEGDVFTYDYGSSSPAALAVSVADASGGVVRTQALLFNAGRLFTVDEFGQGVLEGIYSVDLVTGLATAELIYSAPTTVDIGGLDVDPGTGLFYGSSDDSDSRGIMELDIVVNSEMLIAPYPGTAIDIDGLAYNPNGTVYLIQDEAQPIDVFDVGTLAYTGQLPTAITTPFAAFSGGTFSTVISGGGGGVPNIGTNYCTAVANSNGTIASMSASGSTTASDNDVTVTASSLPLNQFGIFLTSSDQGFVPGANGTSNGNLCLGGAIGRYTNAPQILSTGPTGTFSLLINLTAVPQGNGTVAVMAGDTRNFQAWTRDGVGQGSNFSDGLQIDFN